MLAFSLEEAVPGPGPDGSVSIFVNRRHDVVPVHSPARRAGMVKVLVFAVVPSKQAKATAEPNAAQPVLHHGLHQVPLRTVWMLVSGDDFRVRAKQSFVRR